MSTIEGWNVTDLDGTDEIEPHVFNDTEITVYARQITHLTGPAYWIAPDVYAGNKVYF